MPSETCKGCNRITNSAASDYWFAKDHIPTMCYIAWEEDPITKKLKAVEGCAFNELPLRQKQAYRDIIIGWNKNTNKLAEEWYEELKDNNED